MIEQQKANLEMIRLQKAAEQAEPLNDYSDFVQDESAKQVRVLLEKDDRIQEL